MEYESAAVNCIHLKNILLKHIADKVRTFSEKHVQAVIIGNLHQYDDPNSRGREYGFVWNGLEKVLEQYSEVMKSRLIASLVC